MSFNNGLGEIGRHSLNNLLTAMSASTPSC